MIRVNVGCGTSITKGWINVDNSPSLLLARLPSGFVRLLRSLKVITQYSLEFVEFARKSDIRYCNAARRLPFVDSSVDIIYSSHMLEHMAPEAAESFLKESLRCLRPGGHLRLALPDIRLQVQGYLSHQDADRFVSDMHVSVHPRTLAQRLQYLVLGPRNHQWMYDSASILKRLDRCGYVNCVAVVPGQTTIADVGSLDLHERETESLYVEGCKPA